MLKHRLVYSLLSVTLVVLALALGSHPAHAQAATPMTPAIHHSANTPAIQHIPNCISNPDGKCQGPCWSVPDDYNCDGQDPYGSGCASRGTTSTSGLYTITVTDLSTGQKTNIARIDMRYNTACQSRWTRVTPLLSGRWWVKGQICQDISPYNCDFYSAVTDTADPLWTNIEYSAPLGQQVVATSWGEINYQGTWYQASFNF